jgi:hypothetical protein
LDKKVLLICLKKEYHPNPIPKGKNLAKKKLIFVANTYPSVFYFSLHFGEDRRGFSSGDLGGLIQMAKILRR